MKTRSTIIRICPECKKEQTVRKDGAGILCRPCRARTNSCKKIGKYNDLTGQKFGNLMVIKASLQVNKLYFWHCVCNCGKSAIISGNRIRSGKTKSCGCLSRAQDGLSTIPTYRSWRAMIQRCYDTSVFHYKNYGGRGIQVCERWKNSFSNFLHDMGTRPFKKTLDRIDNSGNYEKSNCKWSTSSEQAKNRRKANAIIENKKS